MRDVPAAQGAKRQIDGDVQHMPGDRPRFHVWRLLPPLRAEVVQCLCRHTWVQGRRAGWPTTRGWECDGILGSGYFSPLGSGVFGFMGTVLGAGQVGVTGFFLGAGACRGACISASKGGVTSWYRRLWAGPYTAPGFDVDDLHEERRAANATGGPHRAQRGSAI